MESRHVDVSQFDLKRATLKNGLEIWAKELDDPNDMVSIRLVIGVGSAHMQLDKLALPHFVEHLVFDCRRKGRIERLTDEIERTGGYLNAETTHESTICGGEARADHVAEYLDLLRLLLTEPDFSEERISREQKVVFTETDEVDRWDYFYTACRKVHGDHPLAYSPIGTCSSLIAITEDDVQSFFHDYYAGKNMILICVGAIQFDELVRAAADELEILRSEGLEWPDYVQPSVHKMPVTYKSHEYYGVTICGYRTCGYLAKDYYALWFLSDHLQESLYDDIRIQGFTYTFEVHYTAYMGEGLFHFYFRALGTAAGRIEQTIDEAVRQTKDSLIDDATFLEKKEGLVNSFRNRISDRDELSECLADFVEHYKRGRELRHDFEELEALTPERIKEVAQRYFRADRHFCARASTLRKDLFYLLVALGFYLFLAWMTFRFYDFLRVKFSSRVEQILVVTCSLLLFTLVLVAWSGKSARQIVAAVKNRLSRRARPTS